MGHGLPEHLQQLVVEQCYGHYSAIDQAIWRYIMRQNVAFHRVHAHSIYEDGLEAAGISVDEIPRVEVVDERLQSMGWRAVAVDGFIPPAAFMEFQARGILPIALDIRRFEHIAYTPAPDIIHESSGHGSILLDETFARFVRRLCELGTWAHSSPNDLALYEAIRHLSFIKEDPEASPEAVERAEAELKARQRELGRPSDANLVSRLYWWTVEYGLIGTVERPKIYGAGLLSSVGESQRCMTPLVPKVPFDLDACLNASYDITSYQPQLFVCESFEQLLEAVEVLGDRLGYPGPETTFSPTLSGPVSYDRHRPPKPYPAALDAMYRELRGMRSTGMDVKRLRELAGQLPAFPEDWLVRLEWLELGARQADLAAQRAQIRQELDRLARDPERRELISNGLQLELIA